MDANRATQLGGFIGPSALVFIKTPRCTTETNQLYETRLVSQAIADCRKAKALREELQKVEGQAAFDAEKRQADLQKAVEEAEANSLKNADIIHMVSQGM